MKSAHTEGPHVSTLLAHRIHFMEPPDARQALSESAVRTGCVFDLCVSIRHA